ncbi:16S rRNA (guanine(966)-N(2))-methyltransferase RsmD [Kordiimonas sp. SCSIO 12610]|uniref:16S rRNA (guanine(966)-N(2))-methyltransferase RsmD n=1 Tax=Kordiimonas sp. SCSIO 12610 TaxID=2829597 RepID=UPI00210F0ADC|nr:16S rRNA (guanine(966)-N(2))-methyltransferase RsmD [Kordiimonas sp. SCSIO 12610]UTW54849.1 16S rRNA (guanine(966)-N(2))-methyltransferase RsmD [Kordiimonas sp. SCSIO 12610]
MTRIIAGKYRGRKLKVAEGRDIRPTTDRMRERVFSMLGHHRYPDMHDARVADLFAGTGALGLEALSRGARHITFVEKSQSSLDNLDHNISSLDVRDHVTVLKVSARALPPISDPYDFIFMDPPYRMGLLEPTLERITSSKWLSNDGVIIAELASDDDIDFTDSLELVDERIQGQQRVVFLKQKPI